MVRVKIKVQTSPGVLRAFAGTLKSLRAVLVASVQFPSESVQLVPE